MKYKTIITDLDRTLLKTDKSLSEYTISTLKKCKENGMNLIIASARPLRNVTNYMKLLDLDMMVLSNGSRVVNNNIESYHLIKKDSANKILEFLDKNKEHTLIIETLDMAYSNKQVSYLETILTNNLSNVINEKDILKIIIEIKDEHTLELLIPYLNDDVYYTVANGIGHVIQIMNKKATKWNGIKKLLKLNNLDPKECIYFGDDNDDVTPLQKCGLGVCPENAIDECKKVSDYICKSNDEDGVAHFIEEYILKEEI